MPGEPLVTPSADVVEDRQRQIVEYVPVAARAEQPRQRPLLHAGKIAVPPHEVPLGAEAREPFSQLGGRITPARGVARQSTHLAPDLEGEYFGVGQLRLRSTHS